MIGWPPGVRIWVRDTVKRPGAPAAAPATTPAREAVRATAVAGTATAKTPAASEPDMTRIQAPRLPCSEDHRMNPPMPNPRDHVVPISHHLSAASWESPEHFLGKARG